MIKLVGFAHAKSPGTRAGLGWLSATFHRNDFAVNIPYRGRERERDFKEEWILSFPNWPWNW